MMRKITFLLTVAFLAFASVAKADTWTDPSWKQMLDESDVVATIVYTSNGDFRAAAKIMTIYKGTLKTGDQIWISGFSNRYGPIDKMHAGDKYLVFLRFNKPEEKRIKYWEEETKKTPELKKYAEAFRAGKAYYVWSPTSGDLKIKGTGVQYDLTQTSSYRKENYYPIKEFEEFLTAYYDRPRRTALCKSLLAAIKPVSAGGLNTQQLMKLFLLGYDQYDPVFEKYVQVKNELSKYALAQLMGNIKTIESRNILITLMDDESSLVQGETVRQLKHEPADLVGPILLKHLKTSGNENFGPSNIMDPVQNRIDGGKVEIIIALGELKFQPAIADLLTLLDTKDETIFKLVIQALKNIGTKEYIPVINKQLDNKVDNLIFSISMMIAEDSLVECLPAFKNFISTCNRNRHPDYDYTVSTCCGIGNFQDKETISFLLSDYERFFTYKDTLESRKQMAWTREYISTFTDLKVREARSSIYRSIYDWSGLNEDFAKTPNLFAIKKNLEDSVRSAFTNTLEKQGYKLNYCIAFIRNTKEVANGQKPVVRYLMEVSTSETEIKDDEKQRIRDVLALGSRDLFMRNVNGWYFLDKQERFDDRNFSDLISDFADYAKAVPDVADIVFLKAVLDNNLVAGEWDAKQIKEAIKEIELKQAGDK